MHKVGLYEARQKFSALVRRAERGETIGITKRERFMAVLTPPRQDERVSPPAKEIRARSKRSGR